MFVSSFFIDTSGMSHIERYLRRPTLQYQARALFMNTVRSDDATHRVSDVGKKSSAAIRIILLANRVDNFEQSPTAPHTVNAPACILS